MQKRQLLLFLLLFSSLALSLSAQVFANDRDPDSSVAVIVLPDEAIIDNSGEFNKFFFGSEKKLERATCVSVGGVCSTVCSSERVTRGGGDAAALCPEGGTCCDEILAKCGDGELDSAEECDDGNTVPDDGCSETCYLEVCGNNNIEAGEECDDGNTVSGDNCSAECIVEFCGDEKLKIGEECDDGNTSDGDGCNSSCEVEECGNGTLDVGEECDDGNVADGDGCSSVCTIQSVCGNTTIESGEECDDGNTDSGDGCSSTCVIEQVCGNGDVEAPEECDDGNTNNNDGCNSFCVTEFCGDNTTQSGEQCDDGNTNDNDGCSSLCVSEYCGDNKKQTSEECDGGPPVNGYSCRSSCVYGFCGDGITQPSNEECDDGNSVDGDSCSNICEINIVLPLGETCPAGEACIDQTTCANFLGTPGSACSSVQNGVCCVVPDGPVCIETDTGAFLTTDPQSPTPTGGMSNNTCVGENVLEYFCVENSIQQREVECPAGTACSGGACVPLADIAECGDGIIGDTETCDNGPFVEGDGCSAECQSEGISDGCISETDGGYDLPNAGTINYTVNGFPQSDSDFCIGSLLAEFECPQGGSSSVGYLVDCIAEGYSTCEAGACVDTCGNGIADNGEECDGTDISGCQDTVSATCSSSCTCIEPTCPGGQSSCSGGGSCGTDQVCIQACCVPIQNECDEICQSDGYECCDFCSPQGSPPSVCVCSCGPEECGEDDGTDMSDSCPAPQIIGA